MQDIMVNESDLYNFLDFLEEYDNTEYDNDTIFSHLNYKQTSNGEENFDQVQTMLNELLYKEETIEENEEIHKDNSVSTIEFANEEELDENTPGLFVTEFIKMSPEEKLNYIEEKYDSYKKQLLDSKNYSENDKFEISSAMDEWFKYIMQNLKDLYKIDEDIHKLNDKSLIKNDWL